jgi:hypothetical protein
VTGGSPPRGTRQAWLERLEAAASGALDDLRGKDDPAHRTLTADMELFAARVRAELEREDASEPGVS